MVISILCACPAGKILVGALLVLDALLHILVVEIELADGVVGAVAGVVVGNDGFERGSSFSRGPAVVLLFLRQVFLNLFTSLIALGGRGEDAGDLERDEIGIGGRLLGLDGLEELVIFDGLVDGSGGEQGIEAAAGGGGIVLGEDGLDDGALGEGLAGLGRPCPRACSNRRESGGRSGPRWRG